MGSTFPTFRINDEQHEKLSKIPYGHRWEFILLAIRDKLKRDTFSERKKNTKIITVAGNTCAHKYLYDAVVKKSRGDVAEFIRQAIDEAFERMGE